MSLPLRECGLKSALSFGQFGRTIVTPLAGVWIEIFVAKKIRIHFFVTPLAGVWIEIII